MKLWTSSVCNDYGVHCFGIFKTEEEAESHIHEYVKEWWDDVAGVSDLIEDATQNYNLAVSENDEDYLTMPDDKHRAISLFFAYHPDFEKYSIDAFDVD